MTTSFSLLSGDPVDALDSSVSYGLQLRFVAYMEPPYMEYALMADGNAVVAHGVLTKELAPTVFYCYEAPEVKPKGLRVCLIPGLQVAPHPEDAEAIKAYYDKVQDCRTKSNIEMACMGL